MLAKHMVQSAIVLVMFAFIGTALVAFTQEETRELIKISERKSLLRNLHAVLDPDTYNNDLFMDRSLVTSKQYLGTDKPVPIFVARYDETPVAVILQPVAPDGYSGDINLLISVKYDGVLAGVRVLTHRETPGLGDFIEARRSNWILDFDHRSLSNPDKTGWHVKRDGGVFDQVTGATITPRAIVKAVHKTLQYVDKNRETLFAAKAPLVQIAKPQNPDPQPTDTQ
jgi:electron transport complex protein RnfG